MLLLDDDDQLPASADGGEIALAARLGTEGLQAVDAALASLSASLDEGRQGRH